MKTNSGNDLDGKKHRTKSHSAIPMIGAIVTGVLLLAGLSLMGNYNVVTAQEMTETPGTEGAAPETECPAPGTVGPTAFGGTAETNATGVEGNDQMSQVRMYLEEARTALQNNDTQTALTCLDQALNQLGAVTGTEANMTGTAPETNMTPETEGAAPETEGAAPETEDGGDGGPLEGIFGGGG
jgi:hypothetical protein